MTSIAKTHAIRFGRFSGLLLAMGTLALTLASPAKAHTDLQSISPTDGARLAKPPSVVILAFNEPLLAAGSRVVISNSDTDTVVPTIVEVRGSKVLVTGTLDLRDGTYAVAYRVVSTDGHPITGRSQFILSGPSPTDTRPEPATSAPSPAENQAPAEASQPSSLTDPNVWIGAAIGTVGGIGIVLIQRRRKKAREQKQQ